MTNTSKKKKTRLTKQEKEMMIKVRDKWIDKFNSLDYDKAKVDKFISYCYELSGLSEPKIIHCHSPLACQYVAHCLKNPGMEMYDVNNKDITDAKFKTMFSYLKYESFSENNFSDFGWVSFYDFFTQIGILKNRKFKKYRDLLYDSNCHLYIAFEGVAIVSEPPVFLNRDTRGRLHCMHDYAISYADGYGQHYVHGIYFKPELFNRIKDKTLSGKDILSLKNHEQKAVLIQEFGYDHILADLDDYKVLDSHEGRSYIDGRPVRYEVIQFNLADNITVRFVKVECHTEHKITTLGVPIEKQTESCLGAIAWTFGMTESDYAKLRVES